MPSYSYPHTAGANPYHPRHRDSFTEPTTWESLREMLPLWATQWIIDLHAYRTRFTATGEEGVRSRAAMNSSFRALPGRLFTIVNALVVLWLFTLWWGERTVFQESLESCEWGNWEQWPQDATPHHVAFVADPQLVDPHTYPGRPWPLSTLTVKFTDQYLRRSFSLISSRLGPDSVLFLGDLFDGGREWATETTSSPEERYKKYKDGFWKGEFHRFMRIFAPQFNEGDAVSKDPLGHTMMASLPGNHDLGFGTGVQVPVRDRFQAFFGKGNRVDVIGNHTFVSVDSVSLSAMDQPDPVTGSMGVGSGDGEQPNAQIWKEAEDFLNNMGIHRGRAEAERLRLMRNDSEGILFDHRVVDNIATPTVRQHSKKEIAGLPAILLTHVPLYREPGTPCGPLREHYPPSEPGLEKDDRNALTIAGGYQYQNVLTPAITKDIVTKVGPNLVHVYSGDDHDYCEVAHREFSGSPKEITVKSISWAMGVRKPGVVLTSLWNPIDPETGKPTTDRAGPATVQNHLCLLPDQLTIFINYGLLFAFTLIILLLRAAILGLRPPQSDPNSSPILPLQEQPPRQTLHSKSPSTSTSSSTFAPGGLASRAMNTNPRLFDQSYNGDTDADTYNSKWKGVHSSRHRQKPGLSLVKDVMVESVMGVAKIVLPVYFFLIWRW
ncbi:cell division control protein/putative DNA repair exonuclease [Aspergillus campestris IBT 28561]|uniref:Cell division control protein/putative DNA repair exonuclease n=1 Tax=Aspergillus campestris (strain IBT 28561) TaxID=1392248 RepID=A0A2I1DB49_ASPC2|nr:cell division control protein/putative DNA repair exonuclease [Aspergillus campestris IBT 28561]PKY07090.1 cell division control protein/putative DNA repair exonuclease [Aspergillus campestris IBT 28561]